MKKVFNYRRAPLWALLWGVLGFVFQYLLQRTGLDHKGLYITDHPAAVCSFVLIPFAMARSISAVAAGRSITVFPSTSLVGRLIFPSPKAESDTYPPCLGVKVL